MTIETLASYQRCLAHITSNWTAFLAKREERLTEQQRFGTAAEKVAENILEDLFSIALPKTYSGVGPTQALDRSIVAARKRRPDDP